MKSAGSSLPVTLATDCYVALKKYLCGSYMQKADIMTMTDVLTNNSIPTAAVQGNGYDTTGMGYSVSTSCVCSFVVRWKVPLYYAIQCV